MQQDSYNLIDNLIDLIDNSKSSFKNTKLVNADEALGLLNDLRITLQEDYSQCQKIATEREKILEEGKQKAAGIIADARAKANQMVEENAITVEARRRAAEIVEQADGQAAVIIRESRDEANRIRRDCEADVERKKEATRAYINTRLASADEYLDKSRMALNFTCGEITKNLEEIRKFHDNLMTFDTPILMDGENNGR